MSDFCEQSKVSFVSYSKQAKISWMKNSFMKQTCHSVTSMHKMSFPFSDYVIESFFIPGPVITKIINTHGVSTAKYNSVLSEATIKVCISIL